MKQFMLLHKGGEPGWIETNAAEEKSKSMAR